MCVRESVCESVFSDDATYALYFDGVCVYERERESVCVCY